jgi:CheY-like chemotaxis protein
MNLSARQFNVLAVDDSVIYRKLVEQSLSGERYSVLSARDGREALDLFAEHQPAVVVTDWDMPDIGGLELCRRIRRDFPGFRSHLILLTGNTDKAQVVERLAAGADLKKWMLVIPIAAVAAFPAWYAFRPERLVVNRRVDEAMPAAQGSSSPQRLVSCGYRNHLPDGRWRSCSSPYGF